MKRIRPDYYDKFACIADQCSITCCQEWKIGVDADTNRKWKKIFPPEDVSPQKKNLSAYTTKKDGGRVIELTEEHKCPFLNENKLCKLVTAYGDNVLSETCAVFPREVHRFKTHAFCRHAVRQSLICCGKKNRREFMPGKPHVFIFGKS